MTARVEGIEYQLELSGVGSDVYVRRIQLRDKFNAPYSIEVECLLPKLRGEPIQAVTNRLVGMDATLTLKRVIMSDLEERVQGVVIGVERKASSFDLDLRRDSGDTGGADEAQDYVFVVHLAPALHMLRMHTWGSGSWHERTYPEVLVKVLNEALGEYGRSVLDKTTQTHKVDHIVRPPGECLLDFATRLMEEAGITAYFVHDGPTETLVLTDTNDAFIEGTQYQPRDQPYRVNYTRRHNVSENILSLHADAAAQTGKVLFESFDAVGTPPVGIVGTLPAGAGSAATTRRWGELRPTELGDPDEQHKRAAQIVVDRDRTSANAVVARTTILGMLPGRTYDLELKPGDVRTYVVSQVEAEGIGAEYGTQQDYANNVTLVPLKAVDGSAVDVRSTQTAPERRMPGLTLAEIVAIENAPADVDRILRCRLKFLWDQVEGESPTTYVSVLQNMAGLFGGTQWIPRAGDRVVVAFHGGRPDRGVILGALYDEQYKPPYMGPPDRSSVLPDSALWLGWNHASIEPGTQPEEQSSLDRHTMLCMDVTANRELFYFAAPKDWRRDVGNDSETNIIGASTIDVGKDLTETVGKSVTQTIGTDYKQDVSAGHTTTVGAKHELTVAATSTVSVTGKRQEKFGTYMMSVESGSSVSMLGGQRVDRIVGSWAASASSSINMQAPSVSISSGSGGGAMGAATGAALSLKTTATLDGPQAAVLKSGSSTVKADREGVASRGAVISATDDGGGKATLKDGKYVLDAPQGVTLRCGASELRLTSEGLYLNGRLVNISATTTKIDTERLDISGDE